jgi:hypothetical protein
MQSELTPAASTDAAEVMVSEQHFEQVLFDHRPEPTPFELPKMLNFPCTGPVQDLVRNVPPHRREEHLQKWQEIAEQVFAANSFGQGIGARNIDSDILYCNRFYAEPRFRYGDQELYWQRQPADLASMAHNKNFSRKDISITECFIDSIKQHLHGGRVLDLCGGIARCGNVLEEHFDLIDVLDLKPSFGNISQIKQGRLFKGNLKNLTPLRLW